MSTIKVYQDITDPKMHIGVRDDGAVTFMFGHHTMETWKEHVGFIYWFLSGTEIAKQGKKDIGEELGTITY